MNRKDYLRQSIDIINQGTQSRSWLIEDSTDKIPEKGDSFKFKGYNLIFDGEKWSGTTDEGTRVRIADARQNAATRKWRESLGDPSDEVRRAAFSALRNTGLKAKESQIAVKRATSVLGADATEEEMIRAAFQYKDREPSPEEMKKKPEGEEASGKSLSDKLGPDKSADDATGVEATKHVEDEYTKDPEKAAEVVKGADIDPESKEPIEKEKAEDLTRAIEQDVEAGEYEERGSDIQETVLELYGTFLPSLKPAITAGKEAKDNKTIGQLSDLEKMGLTFLISMGKIR